MAVDDSEIHFLSPMTGLDEAAFDERLETQQEARGVRRGQSCAGMLNLRETLMPLVLGMYAQLRALELGNLVQRE
jgi:hypothetical protein